MRKILFALPLMLAAAPAYAAPAPQLPPELSDPAMADKLGRMMGALGGRLGAFREALGDEAAFRGAVRRNVFHEAPPSEEALAFVGGRLQRFHDGLAASEARALIEGKVPSL